MGFLQKHKRIFLFSGIALCFVAIILSIFPGVRPTVVQQGVARVVVPMQQGVTHSIQWVQGRFAAMADNERLLNDNAALREEIASLALQVEQLYLAGEENYHLTALLNMRQRFPELPTVGVRVISQNPNNWRARFTIEAGTRDGIEANMPVLAGEAVKGIIGYAGTRHAEVITVLDSDFSIAVHSVRTETDGIVRGDIQLAQQGLMRMDFIAASANIMPGDHLITSVYSPLFPPGLPVGTIVSVHPNADGLTQYAIVEPAAGMERPRMVLVVVGEQ